MSDRKAMTEPAHEVRRLSPGQRVVGLSVAMAALSVLLYVAFLAHVPTPDAPIRITFVLLVAGFGLSELFLVHLQFGREAHTISLSELPLVLGMFFASPEHILLAYLLGAGAMLILHQRQPLLKVLFNLGLFAACTTTALVVFNFIGGGAAATEPRAWLAALLAMLVVDVVAALLVTLVIYLTEEVVDRGQIVGALTAGALAATMNTAFALIGAIALVTDVRTAALLAVVMASFLVAYRGYSSLRLKHSNLELLRGFTHEVGRSPEMETLMQSIIEQTREVLRTEVAELVLFKAGERDHDLRAIARDPRALVLLADPVTLDPALVNALKTGRSISMPQGTTDLALSQYLASRGLRDAMICPLRRDQDLSGYVLVANLLGDTGTFTDDNLRLLETLTSHASVSIDRGQLIGTLQVEAARNEYQARHDTLTGLYNRSHFTESLDHLLSESPDRQLGVMLMDLDHFKEINDTLGHQTGDQVLIELAKRLKASLRDDAIVARLGGDEFAVVVPALKAARAEQVATRLLSALSEPFVASDITIELGASLGLVLSPEHGNDSQTLMKRADVAMYLAKENRGGFAVYSSERDEYTSERLALVSQLRKAIEERSLSVHYQPKIDLSSGEVVGAEALVRWEHPELGMIRPDQFIGLAEHTGLIAPLTILVLEIAMADARHWRSEGWEDFRVAVNLSARSLVDVSLPDQISQMLHRHELPASALQLEITESAIMADPTRAIDILKQLDELGIGLSIDDFGTGYSSFAYLRDLPISELKIDKSFVLNMVKNESDSLIVRSIVDLGRNMKMKVVAEGVGDADIQASLTKIGGILGQGFHISRPIPAPEMTTWLSLRSKDPIVL